MDLLNGDELNFPVIVGLLILIFNGNKEQLNFQKLKLKYADTSELFDLPVKNRQECHSDGILPER